MTSRLLTFPSRTASLHETCKTAQATSNVEVRLFSDLWKPRASAFLKKMKADCQAPAVFVDDTREELFDRESHGTESVRGIERHDHNLLTVTRNAPPALCLHCAFTLLHFDYLLPLFLDSNVPPARAICPGARLSETPAQCLAVGPSSRAAERPESRACPLSPPTRRATPFGTSESAPARTPRVTTPRVGGPARTPGVTRGCHVGPGRADSRLCDSRRRLPSRTPEAARPRARRRRGH